MFSEKYFQSDALAKQARDFVAWSAATGNILSRMSNKPPSKGRAIAEASPELQAFPLERIKILHPRDRIHYPAVLFARSRMGTETHIQSFNLITGAKQRYAHILQTEQSGTGVGIAITRTLPLEPSGVSVKFGRRFDALDPTRCSDTQTIHVDLDGNVGVFAEKRWNKRQIIDWVGTVFHHLTHGVSLQRIPAVAELCERGYYNGADRGPNARHSFLSQR